MMQSTLELIGRTPLLRLGSEPIVAKAEFLNPGGSIKDRIALAMIDAAERDGTLLPGQLIVEPSSGNTGIGVAMVGVARGHPVKIIMPEGMSQERSQIIRAFGAEVVITPAAENVAGAMRKAGELVRTLGAFMPNQFGNPANPRAHYETTAPELWEQSGGRIGAFVSGIGSGGTLQGVAQFLKERNPEIRIVAVEPAACSALLGHEPGLHQIQGIGDGFIPDVLDVSLIDEVLEVTDEAAIGTARALAKSNSLLVGISSGANIWGARQIAARFPGLFVATVLADRAERYFSTSLMNFGEQALPE